MSNFTSPKTQSIIDRSLDKGLYVNDDDQDWGSAGMNDVQEESEEMNNEIWKCFF